MGTFGIDATIFGILLYKNNSVMELSQFISILTMDGFIITFHKYDGAHNQIRVSVEKHFLKPGELTERKVGNIQLFPKDHFSDQKLIDLLKWQCDQVDVLIEHNKN